MQPTGQQSCPHRFCLNHLKLVIETLGFGGVGCPICEFELIYLSLFLIIKNCFLPSAIQKMTRGITIEELQKEKESIEKDTVTISESRFILYNI